MWKDVCGSGRHFSGGDGKPGVGDADDGGSAGDRGRTEEETEPEERIAVDGRIKSYLTGEMVDVSQGDRRPIAVMMSNDRAAQPQYGINRAGVVYEAPVEGDMNPVYGHYRGL